MNKPYLSIIIPILNEIDQLEGLLTALKKNMIFENEIIFVDGGSSDGSYEFLRKKEAYSVIQTKKGRARQQNLGAEMASSDFLYFIHADTIPPYGFDKIIYQAFKQGFKAGSFRLKFLSSHLSLQLASFASRFNNRFCRGGDQSLFIKKKFFESLEGFNEEYLVCEDGELIDRIYKETLFCVLPKEVKTSARRFEDNGVFRLQFHFFMIHLLRYVGRSPTTLNQYYSNFVK
jgi:rSAM/selenodomain-associated transferase 2